MFFYLFTGQVFFVVIISPILVTFGQMMVLPLKSQKSLTPF